MYTLLVHSESPWFQSELLQLQDELLWLHTSLHNSSVSLYHSRMSLICSTVSLCNSRRNFTAWDPLRRECIGPKCWSKAGLSPALAPPGWASLTQGRASTPSMWVTISLEWNPTIPVLTRSTTLQRHDRYSNESLYNSRAIRLQENLN